MVLTNEVVSAISRDVGDLDLMLSIKDAEVGSKRVVCGTGSERF